MQQGSRHGATVKAIADKTTVVLVGSFNPAILVPQWVAVHGLGYPPGQEFQIEVLTSIGNVGPTRYSFNGLSYSADYRRVTLFVGASQAFEPERAVSAAASILEKLPHTPLKGVGFNFGFAVDDPSDALLSLLSVHAGMADKLENGAEVVTRRWGNTVKWGEALVSIDCEFAGGQASVAFNFHYSTESAIRAAEILKAKDCFQIHQTKAIEAARVLTGQELEA